MSFRTYLSDLAASASDSLSPAPRSRDSQRSRRGFVSNIGTGPNTESADSEDIEDFRDLYKSHPLIRESIRTYVEEVLEPGYRIVADSEDTVTELEAWAEEAAIVGGQFDRDVLPFLDRLLTERLVTGTAPIEHVTAADDDDYLAGVKLVRIETLTVYKRPGQNILVRPDDDIEALGGDPSEYVYFNTDGTVVDPTARGVDPTSDDIRVAAFVQYDDAHSFGRYNWDSHDPIPFAADDMTLFVRDPIAGSVRGNSIAHPVKDRAEGMLQKLDDIDQAVRTMAYPHRYVKFGDEEHPWSWEEIEDTMIEYEPGNFEPGQSSGGPADVDIEQYSGDVPTEVLELIQSDVNAIMSAMPIPKYELGGYEENINQFVSRSQENKQNLEIRSERRKLEAELTPLFRTKAEQMDLDTDGLKFKIETEPGQDTGAAAGAGTLSTTGERAPTADDGQPGPRTPAGGEGGEPPNPTQPARAGDDLPPPPNREAPQADASASAAEADVTTDSIVPADASAFTLLDATADAGHPDEWTTDAADPRLVSSEDEYAALRGTIAEILTDIRGDLLATIANEPPFDGFPTGTAAAGTSAAADGGYPAAQTDLAAGQRTRRLIDRLTRVLDRTLESSLDGADLDARMRGPLRSVVESTLDTLGSDAGGQGPAISTTFGRRARQATRAYTDRLTASIRDAATDLKQGIVQQVRQTVTAEESHDTLAARVRDTYNESALRQRAGIIARMQTEHAIDDTRLREYRAADGVTGIRVINPCDESTTRLCKHLAGCGPRDGAVAYFDHPDGKTIGEQFQDHAPAGALFAGFTPLPSTSPFHWGCRSSIFGVTDAPPWADESDMAETDDTSEPGDSSSTSDTPFAIPDASAFPSERAYDLFKELANRLYLASVAGQQGHDASAVLDLDWNPAFHPRDPRTGRFVERPWSVPDALRDLDTASIVEGLAGVDPDFPSKVDGLSVDLPDEEERSFRDIVDRASEDAGHGGFDSPDVDSASDESGIPTELTQATLPTDRAGREALVGETVTLPAPVQRRVPGMGKEMPAGEYEITGYDPGEGARRESFDVIGGLRAYTVIPDDIPTADGKKTVHYKQETGLSDFDGIEIGDTLRNRQSGAEYDVEDILPPNLLTGSDKQRVKLDQPITKGIVNVDRADEWELVGAGSDDTGSNAFTTEAVFDIPAPGGSGGDSAGLRREEWGAYADADSDQLKGLVADLKDERDAETEPRSYRRYQYEKRIRYLSTLLWYRDDARPQYADMTRFHEDDPDSVSVGTLKTNLRKTLDALEPQVGAALMADIPQGIHNDNVDSPRALGQYGRGAVSVDRKASTTLPHELGHSLMDTMGMNDPRYGNNKNPIPIAESGRLPDHRFYTPFDGPEGGEEEAFYARVRDEWGRMTAGEVPFLSGYATMNGDEFLAVGFGMWINDPEKLERIHPELAELFEEFFGPPEGR
jgi:hypothetical protein